MQEINPVSLVAMRGNEVVVYKSDETFRRGALERGGLPEKLPLDRMVPPERIPQLSEQGYKVFDPPISTPTNQAVQTEFEKQIRKRN